MPALLKSKSMRYLKREGAILHGTFHGRLYGFVGIFWDRSKGCLKVRCPFLSKAFIFLYKVLLLLHNCKSNPKTPSNKSSAVYPKDYRKYAYALALKISFVCLSLVWPKKLHFEEKIDSFFTSMIIIFLVLVKTRVCNWWSWIT